MLESLIIGVWECWGVEVLECLSIGVLAFGSMEC